MKEILKEIKVEEAIGYQLGHDLTKIVPGEFKGRAFKKGHIIREEDIPELLNIGKEHIYVIDLPEGILHENDVANRLAKVVAGKNVEMNEPHEGKVTLTSAIFGLAKIDEELVNQINAIPDVALATILNNKIVQPGSKLAGTRALPLVIEEKWVQQAEEIAQGKSMVQVKEFIPYRVGLVTTGSEVFKGRIKDRFGPIVRGKLEAFGSTLIEQRFAPDAIDAIQKEIAYFVEQKVDMILVSGGMSVDPDDRTPSAIRGLATEVVSQGTPMLPGSMLMVASIGDIPILGLPGGVLHDPYTAFDAVLPRILVGEKVTKDDIIRLGYGGYFGC